MDFKSVERKITQKEKVINDSMIDELNYDDLKEEEKLVGEGNLDRKTVIGCGKRGSNSGGASPPSCQAEKCGADLTYAKKYHRRHKVCEFHSKAPVVMVSGLRQRFCQQCSRFHEIAEFDESKRSCRKRLAKHNERRRTRPMSAAAKLHPRLVPMYQATAGSTFSSKTVMKTS